MMDFLSVVQALENSPKGQLKYETGWDESPNAITSLITVVQEKEIDKPNREIVERAFTSFYQKDRLSFSPKTSPTSRVTATRGRRSLPVTANVSKTRNDASGFSPALLSSNIYRRIDYLSEKYLSEVKLAQNSRANSQEININVQSEPRIEVQEVTDDLDNAESSATISSQHDFGGGGDNIYRRRLLTPPTRIIHRKKSFDGSPIFKPSPSFSSSTQTQTHSSATSDATSVTPTRKPVCNRKTNKFGIKDEGICEEEEKVEEDLLLESRVSPYAYIESRMVKFQEEEEERIKTASLTRILKEQKIQQELDSRLAEAEAVALKLKREQEESLKQAWIERERLNLQDLQLRQESRRKNDEKLNQERKALAAAAAASRKAAHDAAVQDQLRKQKATEDEHRRREEANLAKQRLLQQKVAEENRLAEEHAAEESRKRLEAQKKSSEVVPELQGLILKEELSKFAKTSQLLKTFEEPTAHIDGKDPATKAFYIGAVKCINTPLNALADTSQGEIMAKVQHFSKLLTGEPVSGGGSMTTMFSCTSVQNGNIFVMKTFAFRFVKKSEADVTRGKSTVQPLATVGVLLCKKFPQWAALVQANLYKLCPFLVPFSYPQGDKSIQEYAKELGHDLSGSETAIQQTFLERLKGYCTLYALMILKFNNDGPFDIGDATNFFTIGGAWHIIATTMKLEPQVDVTATVIHTLLEILDDRLHAVYRSQFIKLMRFLIIHYLPKIKSITPPAKSGSLNRLQIYLEKKFAI